jgi:hypothetical protein
MAQASIDGRFARSEPEYWEQEPLPLVRRRANDNEWNASHHEEVRRSLEQDEAWREFDRFQRTSTDHISWEEELEERAAEEEWRRRKPRRIAIRALGWLSIAAALLGVAAIAQSAAGRSAILEWGTLASTASSQF